MTQHNEQSIISLSTEARPHWSEDQLRLLLQPQQDVLFLADANGTITSINQALLTLFGLAPAHLIGTPLVDILDPNEQDAFADIWHIILQHPGTPQVIVCQTNLPHSSHRWMELNLANHLHTPGLEQIVGSFHPIASPIKTADDPPEQVRQRQRLEKSEARLWRLVNSNIVGISFTNLKGEILDANENLLTMIGYTREDVSAGKLYWNRITLPEYADLDRQALQEIASNGAVSRPYEKEYLAKDGSRIPVLVGGASLDTSQGEIVTFVIDMRPQKQMERELRTAKEQLEAILQNVGDGITVQNADGTIVYANPVAAHMSGFPSVEAMLSATPEDYQRALNRFVIKDEEGNILAQEDFPGRRVLREGKNVQMLLQYNDTLTGATYWSFIKSQPIFLEEGQVHFAVNILVDLSERQALEQRKNEFISMASHELKTPVTALKGFANVLQRRYVKQGDEQALHVIQRMDAQLNKLTRLINDLLDISKMQAGKLALQEEIFDLAALIYEIAENVQGTTSTHLITVETVETICVFGDKDRLGQVLINLLNNAIKYSPQAKSIILRAVTDEQQVTVSVQDFGIGIADAYHQHIFERFYQVTEPQEQTYPGLGIGLYIVQDIVKRHHGNIWVESSKGQGSTFFFTLPLSQL